MNSRETKVYRHMFVYYLRPVWRAELELEASPGLPQRGPDPSRVQLLKIAQGPTNRPLPLHCHSGTGSLVLLSSDALCLISMKKPHPQIEVPTHILVLPNHPVSLPHSLSCFKRIHQNKNLMWIPWCFTINSYFNNHKHIYTHLKNSFFRKHYPFTLTKIFPMPTEVENILK